MPKSAPSYSVMCHPMPPPPHSPCSSLAFSSSPHLLPCCSLLPFPIQSLESDHYCFKEENEGKQPMEAMGSLTNLFLGDNFKWVQGCQTIFFRDNISLEDNILQPCGQYSLGSLKSHNHPFCLPTFSLIYCPKAVFHTWSDTYMHLCAYLCSSSAQVKPASFSIF